MTYLFVQTLVIQFFVGIAFLLLGLWGGKFLWGHDRHHHPARGAERKEGGGAGAPEPEPRQPNGAQEKAIAELREEVRQLRMLNGKLEKKNRTLQEKAGDGEPVTPEAMSVEEAPEVIEMVVESEIPSTSEEKSGKTGTRPDKSAAKGERDELIRIRGIGKVMAVNLEKRGIRTYRQIAGWTKEEIAKLPYGSRVARDKWQMQAKRLHKEKYGERI